MGGGVSSAVARALGAGNADAARELVVHALVIAVGAGLALHPAAARPRDADSTGCSAAAARRWRRRSPTRTCCSAAPCWSGSPTRWRACCAAAATRWRPRSRSPARPLVQIPLSGALTLGWGPFPQLGITGTAALLRSRVRTGEPRHGGAGLARRAAAAARRTGGSKARLFRDILRVGAISSVSALQTVLTAVILTGFVARFGTAALAGYGVGVRLELLQMPHRVRHRPGAGRHGRHQHRRRAGGARASASPGPAPRRRCWSAWRSAGPSAAYPPLWIRIFSDDAGGARDRQPLHAHRGAVLPAVRRRHGALLRLAGRGAGAAAGAGRHGAPRCWWPRAACW